MEMIIAIIAIVCISICASRKTGNGIPIPLKRLPKGVSLQVIGEPMIINPLDDCLVRQVRYADWMGKLRIRYAHLPHYCFNWSDGQKFIVQTYPATAYYPAGTAVTAL